MASMIKPLIGTYEADGAITKGCAVKFVTAKGGKRVVQATATTDSVCGVAQSAAVNAGDLIEVARPGGGGKGLAKTTIAAGNRLGCNADGSLQKVATQGDSEFATADNDAVAGDIFAIMLKGNTSAYASQA